LRSFNVPAQDIATILCQIKRLPAGVKTLKDSLNGMVKTGESFLAADITNELVVQGMDMTAAEKEAEARCQNLSLDTTSYALPDREGQSLCSQTAAAV
jgi:hypothetical protein